MFAFLALLVAVRQVTPIAELVTHVIHHCQDIPHGCRCWCSVGRVGPGAVTEAGEYATFKATEFIKDVGHNRYINGYFSLDFGDPKRQLTEPGVAVSTR